MQCPAAAIFDLDDTLAESFQPPSPEMLDDLKQLLQHIPVAIMTGATLERMQTQFLSTFETHPHADRLYIFPTSSAQGYTYTQGKWRPLYDLALTEEDRERIRDAIKEAVDALQLEDIPHYGEQMMDRGSQIAYTHVGIDAPKDVKDSWDPDGSKRQLLWSALKKKFPEFEILMGGKTTIDITLKDVNKSYGVKWLSQHLDIPASEMLYVGDAFYENGNDAVVIPTGIQTRAVEGPDETKRILEELISVCKV